MWRPLGGCQVRGVVRLFFFFQAEDGIRDYKVTGVQTCALPICPSSRAVEQCQPCKSSRRTPKKLQPRSEEHTSELQSPCNLVCRLLLEKKMNHHHPYDECWQSDQVFQQNSLVKFNITHNGNLRT